MSCVAVTSIFVLAFPLTMISMQYSHVVRLFAQRRRRKAEMRAEARQRVAEAEYTGDGAGGEDDEGSGRRRKRGWGVTFSRFGRRRGGQGEAQRREMEVSKRVQVEKWVLGTDGKRGAQEEEDGQGPHVAINVEGVEDVEPNEIGDVTALQSLGAEIGFIGDEYEGNVDDAEPSKGGTNGGDVDGEARFYNPVVFDDHRMPRLEETVSEGTLNDGGRDLLSEHGDALYPIAGVGMSAPLIMMESTVLVDRKTVETNDDEFALAIGASYGKLLHHDESKCTENNLDVSPKDAPENEVSLKVEPKVESNDYDPSKSRTIDSENPASHSVDRMPNDIPEASHGPSFLKRAPSRSSIRMTLLGNPAVRQLRHHRSHDETIARRLQHNSSQDPIEFHSLSSLRQSDTHQNTNELHRHLNEHQTSDAQHEGDGRDSHQHDGEDSETSAHASHEHRHRHHQRQHHHSSHHDEQSENGSHTHRQHHRHHRRTYHDDQSENGSHTHKSHHHRHHHNSSSLDAMDSVSQTSRSQRHHQGRHHHPHHHSHQDSLDRSHGSQALDLGGSETHSQHLENDHPREQTLDVTSNAGTHSTVTPKQRMRTTFNVVSSLFHMSHSTAHTTAPIDTDAVPTTTATQSVRRLRTRAVVPDPFRRPTSSAGAQGAMIESIEIAMATLLAGRDDGSDLAFPDVIRIGMRVVGWEHEYLARSQEDVLVLKMAVGSQERYRFIMKVLAALQ
ncbi:hypothetical protein BJ742DRAFT_778396 [Cladochytrium replicatum]|nr:hypothetical protein BJ742DRAFT_778396 [Cladochytrium replicatum]